MIFTAKEFKLFIKKVIEMIESKKDYLCELDRKIGDGDHGITMSIGFQEVDKILEDELNNEKDCSKISIKVGKTFLNAVGSSVGPLYATGFMRGAKEIKNKEMLSEKDLISFWIAFGEGIKERGGAKVGEKTMVDTIDPFVNFLKKSNFDSNNILEIFQCAVCEAKHGMESTEQLISKKGRASRLGERSIGVQDPGATSIYFILCTFLSYFENLIKISK